MRRFDSTVMAQVAYYGTGRRKTSVARVWITPGQGRITINDRDLKDYFVRDVWFNQVLEPLVVTKTLDKYDVKAYVKGGGLTGQAGAVRHGLARALLNSNDSFRRTLKTAGLLTRDARMVESKKYGRKKARRGQQFSKR